jgi:hypothetical protein
MTRRLSICATLVALSALAGCSGAAAPPADTASATATDEAAADRLEATGKAQEYRKPTAGSDIDTGGAIILVDAPMDEVIAELQHFDNYAEIFPRIQDARAVGRKGKSTDVYLRAPVLDGTTAIWAVTRFSEPKPWREDGKQIHSRFVKGNLKAWRGVWKVEPIGESQTALRIELFIDVKLPVPDAWVTPELMWASGKAVTAIRDIVEKGESTVKDD